LPEIGPGKSSLCLAFVQFLLGDDVSLEKLVAPLIEILGQLLGRLCSIERGFESGHIDLGDEIPLSHVLALFRADPRDPPRRIRSDPNVLPRFCLSGQNKDVFHGSRLHSHDGHLDRFVLVLAILLFGAAL